MLLWAVKDSGNRRWSTRVLIAHSPEGGGIEPGGRCSWDLHLQRGKGEMELGPWQRSPPLHCPEYEMRKVGGLLSAHPQMQGVQPCKIRVPAARVRTWPGRGPETVARAGVALLLGMFSSCLLMNNLRQQIQTNDFTGLARKC